MPCLSVSLFLSQLTTWLLLTAYRNWPTDQRPIPWYHHRQNYRLL